MSEAQLRPRYRYRSALSPEKMKDLIYDALKNPEVNLKNLQKRSTKYHVILSYPREHRHFWSPIMDMNIEPRPDKTSLVRVLIGPEPSIWTLFMFFYTLGGLAVILGLVFGTSQYMLGKGSWLFGIVPLGLILIAFFYFAALAGKRRADEQMRELKSFVEGATGEAIFHEELIHESEHHQNG